MLKLRHLIVPVALLSGASLAAAPTHTVAPGETLSGIAQAHGTSVERLAEDNGLVDPNLVWAGHQLRLPSAATQGTSPAAGSAATSPTGTLSRDGAVALIDRVAREQNWSPAFVKALAWQESGFDQQAVSHAGAVGIMQVMPATGDFISTYLVGRPLDLHDPQDNVLAGVVYLQHLWEVTDGDVEMTLAGYYQGLRSVRENGRYTDTEQYIVNVLALRERFR